MAIQEANKQIVEYFLGTITEVLDPVLYKIKCDIPGEFEGITAFPKRGEVDEPRVGDCVLLMSFDPIYHSFFLYEKLKENGFIGFRSNGKLVSITPDYIELGVFDPSGDWGDDQGDSKYNPEPMHWIQMDKKGNLDIALNGSGANVSITASGKGDIYLNGDFSVWSGGNIEIKSSGNLTIEAKGTLDLKGSMIKFGGGGILCMNGKAMPGTPGPFMVMDPAPAPGTPNITSTMVKLNE